LSIICGHNSDNAAIIWDLRIPRVIAAVSFGGALSVSGFLLQTFFANPLAGPFVLGVSSGAKLAVSIVMITLLSRGEAVSSGVLILAAFVGAMVSMGAVLAASHRVQRTSMLVVNGVMTGYLCSAVTELIITFADESNIVNLHSWSMGSFSGISWDNLRVAVPVIFTALAAAFLMSKPISGYQMGEAYAISLGVNIRVFRTALILSASVLSACAAAFAGPVSFVGVAVPHLAKSLFQTAKPLIMLPACFLGGAAFCLMCDLIARTLFAPIELSISTVTAFFGAPIVIYVMIHSRSHFR